MFGIKLLIATILALFLLSEACVVNGPNGSFDLASISGKDYSATVKSEDSDGQIETTICAKKSTKCKSATSPDGVCFLTSGDYVFNLGNWEDASSDFVPPVANAKEDDSGKYLSISFDNSSSFMSPKFELRIRCGKGQTTGYTDSPSGLAYSMHIFDDSLAFCSGGLSGGWIFIIILLSVAVLYVVAGMVYAVKFQQKPLSITSLPGFYIFPAVFSLAKDGIMFLYGKITKKSSQTESYSSYGTIEE